VVAIDDEFVYGDAFLVAPVVEPGQTSRRIYIPKGKWYDFWEGTLTAGPQITRVEAPINRIPTFVRAGSVVPAWPVMQSTAECPVERLILHVYPGAGRAGCTKTMGTLLRSKRAKGESQDSIALCNKQAAPHTRQICVSSAVSRVHSHHRTPVSRSLSTGCRESQWTCASMARPRAYPYTTRRHVP